MKKLFKLFLAYFRLSKSAVCEMSKGRSEYLDFHDYPDAVDDWFCEMPPFHFHLYTCSRCGKKFYI
ncbi:MAG: hypothetical protein EBU90_31505 [Proteobacteria bacterium]|nr:hypothetical protein [Pseudomonadota bacterium]